MKPFCSFVLTVLFIVSCYAAKSQVISFAYDVTGNRISKSILGNIPTPKVVGDTATCQGSIVHLSASGGNVYSWNIGGSKPNIAVLLDSTRTYTVTAYGPSGCPVSKSHTVRVISLPVTDSISGPSLVVENSIDTFTAPYHPGSVYHWIVNSGVIVNGAGTNKIAVKWTQLKGTDIVTVHESVGGIPCHGSSAYKNVLVVPVSVDKFPGREKVSLYPNPTKQGCYIEFNSEELKEFTLVVADLKGNVIHQRTLPKEYTYKIPLDERLFHVPGHYLIKIQSHNSISVQKLTVTK